MAHLGLRSSGHVLCPSCRSGTFLVQRCVPCLVGGTPTPIRHLIILNKMDDSMPTPLCPLPCAHFPPYLRKRDTHISK